MERRLWGRVGSDCLGVGARRGGWLRRGSIAACFALRMCANIAHRTVSPICGTRTPGCNGWRIYMNGLLDWMIRGLLCLLEIMLCIRLRGKGKSPGRARTERIRGLEYSHGVGLSSPIEIVEVEYLKWCQLRTRRRLFQAVIRDSNRSVNEIGTASRPRANRRTSTSPSAPTSSPLP